MPSYLFLHSLHTYTSPDFSCLFTGSQNEISWSAYDPCMTNNSLGLLKVLLYSRPMISKSIITITSVQQFTHRNSLSCTDSLPILRFSPRRPGQFIMLFYLPLVSIKSVYIVTDSQSVLNILFNSSFNNNGNYIISRIKLVLDEAAALNIDIEFVWVSSHTDVTGNGKADTYARQIISSDSGCFFKVYSDYFFSLKEKFDNKIDRVLIESSNTKRAHYFQHKKTKTMVLLTPASQREHSHDYAS